MSKKNFQHLKSTLADIRNKEHKLSQLQVGADKSEESIESPMSLFDIPSEKEKLSLDSSSYEGQVKLLKKKKLHLNSECERHEILIRTYEKEVDQVDEKLDANRIELEDSRDKVEKSKKEISKLEDEHLDGENWKIFETQNKDDKLREMATNTIEIDDNGMAVNDFWAYVFPFIGILIGLGLLFGGGYTYQCNNGEEISAFLIDDGDDDCADGDDELESAEEYQNIFYEMFSCCAIPISLLYIGFGVDARRGGKINLAIEAEQKSLIEEFDTKYGTIMKDLNRHEQLVKHQTYRIDRLEREGEQLREIPQKLKDTKFILLKYTNDLRYIKKELQELNEGHNNKIKTLEEEISSAYSSIRDLIPYSDKVKDL
ncbi:hypothetical protein N9V30_00580 [Candidatus Poseidoniales archaeon]|nr:hypothetical protein [Candidatus Poseidoniales archaeon]